MPEYLAPGVYLEEIDLESRTIEGVSTSTAGFAGEAERGPTRPTLVTSWQAYARRYGGFTDPPSAGEPRHYLPYAVRGFFENGGTRLVIVRITGSSAAAATLTAPGPSGSLQLRATGPGSWGNHVRVVVETANGVPERFRLRVTCGDVIEEFDGLSADPTRPDFAGQVVNPVSDLIEITGCSGPPASIDTFLAGGTDAPAMLADFVGIASSDTPSGLAGLASIRGISMLATPDDVTVAGLAQALCDTCETLRDRFAVTSVPDPQRDVTLIRPIRDTSWGAMYYPWLRVDASHTSSRTALVPPTGHVCGVFARVDALRGVYKAPANEPVKGLVRGAGSTSGSLSHAVTRSEQEILNRLGVNVIRDFEPPRGVLVWGARTMSTDNEWKYINVRRFFIFLEQSIGRGLQWVVFEPNAEPTWLAVRQAVEDFLTRIWREGGLVGNRVNDAFFVKCDRTTMTQDDIDNGRLVCAIGVAPIKPAEFVVFRIFVRTTPTTSPA